MLMAILGVISLPGEAPRMQDFVLNQVILGQTGKKLVILSMLSDMLITSVQFKKQALSPQFQGRGLRFRSQSNRSCASKQVGGKALCQI